MNTPVSAMAWVTFGAFIGSLGAVGFKAGAKRLELNLLSVLRNWQLAAGVAGYLLSSVFFVLGLRRGELSVLFPMVSTGYIWTMLWSKLFFKEPLTRGKYVGLTLILAGCVLLGLGNRQPG
jgi:drug/metabolite transporter (DMT)-like permease